MHRNDPLDIVKFCDDPKKYPQNPHTPKNIIFSEYPKNIEIPNYKPTKITRAYVCMKISEYPPGVLPVPGERLLFRCFISKLYSCSSILLVSVNSRSFYHIFINHENVKPCGQGCARGCACIYTTNVQLVIVKKRMLFTSG